MAMTGGKAKLVKTSTTGGGSTLQLYVYYKSTQNTLLNQSTITMGMYIVISAGSIGAWTGSGSYLGTTSNTFAGSVPASTSGTYWIAENKTMTVDHDADGSKTATIKWKWGVNSSWGGMVNPSGSFTVELPTIARITTPTFSASSVAMGSTVTITLNRASSSYTHTLFYAFGSLSGQTAGLSASSGVGTSATFTPPTSLAAQIPNASSGTCTLTCATYNGSTLIGTSTVSLTLTVPSSGNPTISAFTVSEADSRSIYAKNLSKVTVGITASGSNGATIAKYETTIQGKSYLGNSFTSDILTASGSTTISLTVTDSRGNTATATRTITVYDYSKPSINHFWAYRCDSSGNISTTGTKVSIDFKIQTTTAAISGLTRTYKLKYKKEGDSSFTQFSTSSSFSSGSYSLADYFTSITLSTDYSYIIRLEVYDSVSGSSEMASSEVSLPTGFTLVDFNKNGKGMAIGKVSEGYRFEIARETELINQYFARYSNSPFVHFKQIDGVLCGILKTGSGGYGYGLGLILYNGDNDTATGDIQFTPTGGITTSGDISAPNIKSGSVDITPSASGVPTSVTITFDTAFSSKPNVVATPVTSVPGTVVTGVGVANISVNSFDVFLTRVDSKLTKTTVKWIAMTT